MNKDKANSEDNASTNEDEGNEGVCTSLNNQESRANDRNGCNGSSSRTEIRRSTVKDLIERYFYQLISGCGNPMCTNINCVSSGKVEPMAPNEAAAEALKLFSQDAQLCYSHNNQQVTKHGTTSGRSHTEDVVPPLTINSSANSTRTSNLTSASTSASSSRRASNTSPLASTGTNSTSTSTNSSSARPNGFFLELAFNSDQTSNSNLPSSGQRQRPARVGGSGGTRSGTSSAGDASSAPHLKILQDASKTKDTSLEQQQRVLPNSTSAGKGPRSDDNALPSFEASSSQARALLVSHLDEKIIDEFIEQGKVDGEYKMLLNAINVVFSSIYNLSRSFRRPRHLTQNGEDYTAAEAKLQELLGKSASDFKKEDLRSMEGENEKDEDSTQYSQTNHAENDENPTTAIAAAPVRVEQATPRASTTSVLSSAATTAHGSELSYSDENNSAVIAMDFTHLNGTSGTLVDLESLRRVKAKLAALHEPIIGERLNTNIILLAETIMFHYILWDWEQMLHCLVICFDLITDTSNNLIDFELSEYSLPRLCHAVRVMQIEPQARLTRIWSVHCKNQLHSLVHCCQQLISLNAIVDEAEVQENADVFAATTVLKIAYYASILAGETDPPKNPILNGVKDSDAFSAFGASSLVTQQDEESDLFNLNFDADGPRTQYPRFADDVLAKELNLRAMYCRNPVVPYDEFYNEPLSDNIQMDRDYLCYKKLLLDPRGEESHFSFMLYSFILTPATKVVGLYYDSRIRMYSERHSTMYSIINFGLFNADGTEINPTPELKLKVRRDNIVNDALVGLELLALSNPKNLKKQLVIEFVGEQGIDEGGVSKEFFQLIVDEIFNVDFGMFMEMEETQTFWFNSMSFENDAQFTLIGIIIGLAIYNSIILAVRFPMVVYRKLMGAEGSFYDLKDFSPTLYRSLKSMLDYMDDDMEDVFMQTFKISYKNVFGDVVEQELKPGGGDIFVDQTNKLDFVDLYADFLLNSSIERQFEAFKKGFEMVTDESPLRLLFRPEEVELLVCGSRKFDFVELEKSTEYEGGYSKDTQIIKYFWEIVHSMPEESKRKLLEFTTGSDRVPVGGLSRLKLLITRQGPDCDRLPTSHTCYNILLLPEYSSKGKLEERLLKAITYSKGFGML